MPTDKQQFIEEAVRNGKIRFPKRFRLFAEELKESLALDILRFMGEIDLKAFEKFVTSVYGLSIWTADIENRLSFERKVKETLRASRKRFTSARIHLRNSLDEFSEAQKILREEMSEVLPGTLRFREIRAELEKLRRTVVELEADGSALIHPQLRTDTEKTFAQASKIRRRVESTYPASEKSAKVHHDAIALLDKVIKGFDTKNKVPSNHVDKFIARFFAVLGTTVEEEENIKTIRSRLKKRPKEQSYDSARDNVTS